jgi:hypothetical protein
MAQRCQSMWGKGRGLGLNDPFRLRVVTRQCGAWLALLALTLQLTMSFGHFHARDFAGDGIGYATAGTAKGWRSSPGLIAATLKQAKLADDEDFCPICFSASLLGNSFVPHAVQPSLLAQFVDIRQAIARDFDRIVQARRAPFQSRAPPLV